MAFIRKRYSGKYRGRDNYSYQVIETYREGGKVKQRVLINLGPSPTIEQALERARKGIEFWTREAQGRGLPFPDSDPTHWRRSAQETVSRLHAYLEELEAVVSRKMDKEHS